MVVRPRVGRFHKELARHDPLRRNLSRSFRHERSVAWGGWRVVGRRQRLGGLLCLVQGEVEPSSNPAPPKILRWRVTSEGSWPCLSMGVGVANTMAGKLVRTRPSRAQPCWLSAKTQNYFGKTFVFRATDHFPWAGGQAGRGHHCAVV